MGTTIQSCVNWLITQAKSDKEHGFLNPIGKAGNPLLTYHVDHVGSMEQISKYYDYILVIVDAFSKLVWLYPTFSYGSAETIHKLTRQSIAFVSERKRVFTSSTFKEYCKEQSKAHPFISPSIRSGNGQDERHQHNSHNLAQ
uniref:Integrase catalytic domain-containing protein n=1 Tax=Glossina morsitans morsitans TaxID=37546 RepID=A0A1B0FRH8_GLOMM